MDNQSGIGEPLRELALFAGAGGGILGGIISGWRTVCAVECEPYPVGILVARQNDGSLPPFPIWDDIRDFDGRPWRGLVDVVSGGFPCQDISSAGKGAGIGGARSGLWSEMARIVREVRPRFVFVENSPNLVTRGLAVVVGDLAALRYASRWLIMGADEVGAPHRRKRIWILASDADRDGESALPVHDETSRMREIASGAEFARLEGYAGDGTNRREPGRDIQEQDGSASAAGLSSGTTAGDWWRVEPSIRGMADGMADELDQHGSASAGYAGRVAAGVPARVQKLKAIGNGQVPLCAATAFAVLKSWIDEDEEAERKEQP